MHYKLNVGLLVPGDIILVGYNDKDSREIQKRTNSKYSHAMLYWKGVDNSCLRYSYYSESQPDVV